MFSALKKLVGSEQAPGRDKNIPAGLQSMNQALQRRFAKGVQYNSECKPGVQGSCQGDVESGVPGHGRRRTLLRRLRRPGPRRLGLGRDQVASRTRKHWGPRRAPGPRGLRVDVADPDRLCWRCAEPLPVARTLGAFTWGRELMPGRRRGPGGPQGRRVGASAR